MLRALLPLAALALLLVAAPPASAGLTRAAVEAVTCTMEPVPGTAGQLGGAVVGAMPVVVAMAGEGAMFGAGAVDDGAQLQADPVGAAQQGGQYLAQWYGGAGGMGSWLWAPEGGPQHVLACMV